MTREPLILVGGGGHCKSCIDVIELEANFEIVGILDLPENVGQQILGYPVMGTDADIGGLAKEVRNFCITLGQIRSPERRISLYQQLKMYRSRLPAIISPLAHVSRHAIVGEGTIVMHQAVINAGAQVGINCIINTKALIEHDAVIGNHCHISTASVVNGGVTVGTGTFYGSGAVSKQGITIAEKSFVKANSLVTGI
ncbi:NeuD/PglB/VioB family sugar acetyltransferase [Geobacter sp. DSM 9736]|uniref:NeuD/PglB/VioB family sugar acetyltransferase n=1 Tax=Geobacter sp. DSM 9736 TaxID=1277350 RepID=UPI000B505CD9|nr:NeuD/PglB/VioB family sugar acetyltransferase [Geobacter sp. DSM 9736]SNB45039.1 sugar O-acyltransferase, sialic acid O-acetyltransferase NeuD family [Geobacter sp. DSM 9736]